SHRRRPFFSPITPPPSSTLFPYTTLFRSEHQRDPQQHDAILDRAPPQRGERAAHDPRYHRDADRGRCLAEDRLERPARAAVRDRSEEHTSELQSRSDLVCRLLLEKKNETT